MKAKCSWFDTYGSFESLESAKTACSSNGNCIAIQDIHCDSKAFRLCTKRFNINEKCPIIGCDCVHKKEGSNGKLYLISNDSHQLCFIWHNLKNYIISPETLREMFTWEPE